MVFSTAARARRLLLACAAVLRAPAAGAGAGAGAGGAYGTSYGAGGCGAVQRTIPAGGAFTCCSDIDTAMSYQYSVTGGISDDNVEYKAGRKFRPSTRPT